MARKTVPNIGVLTGSIVLEKGTHFLSKQIIMHMRIYAILTGREPLGYSHAETLIWNEKARDIVIRGEWRHLEARCLYTIGARGEGTDISKVTDYYGKNEILILRPRIILYEKDEEALWAYFDEIKDHKYQTGNFAAWITDLKIMALLPFLSEYKKELLLNKLWLAKKGDGRTYCYELAARFSSIIKRWENRLDRVASYHLYENPNYQRFE